MPTQTVAATELIKEVTKDGKYLPLLLCIMFLAIGAALAISGTNFISLSTAADNERKSLEADKEGSEDRLENREQIRATNQALQYLTVEVSKLTSVVAANQKDNAQRDILIDRNAR